MHICNLQLNVDAIALSTNHTILEIYFYSAEHYWNLGMYVLGVHWECTGIDAVTNLATMVTANATGVANFKY